MKVTRKTNYRVVVEPRTHIFGIALSDDTIQKDVREIESQIKRHIDNIGYLSVQHDTEETCSYCGLTWEVSEDDSDPYFPKGTPVCCQKAIDEHLQKKQAAANGS